MRLLLKIYLESFTGTEHSWKNLPYLPIMGLSQRKGLALKVIPISLEIMRMRIL